MKGLSLTLQIVIIAIVLLVTALVILTIFGGQIAKILGIMDPLADETLKQTNCRNACATYCMLNPEITDFVDWSVVDRDGSGDCVNVMQKAGAERGCDCQ